jgi:hypothetical protein
MAEWRRWRNDDQQRCALQDSGEPWCRRHGRGAQRLESPLTALCGVNGFRVASASVSERPISQRFEVDSLEAIKWRVDIFREYLRGCFRIGMMVDKS